MKKIAIISLVCVLVVGCIVAVVMSNSIERAIIGTWEVVGYGEGNYIEFEKEKFTCYADNDEVLDGSYQIEKKSGLLILTITDPSETVSMQYTYKDDQLYLSVDGERRLTLKKAGS